MFVFLPFLNYQHVTSSDIVCQTGGLVRKSLAIPPFAPTRWNARPFFESESQIMSAAHLSFSVSLLIYFPLLIRASAGFDSSSGIAQRLPIFTAPGMRSSLHNICMRRGEMPQRSAVCGTERYFIVAALRSVCASASPRCSYKKP